MRERLDRIEQQQQVNTANIADLITLSGNVIRAAELNTANIAVLSEDIAKLEEKIDEGNQRFEVLRQEAIEDRRLSDQRIEAMQANIVRILDRMEGEERL